MNNDEYNEFIKLILNLVNLSEDIIKIDHLDRSVLKLYAENYPNANLCFLTTAKHFARLTQETKLAFKDLRSYFVEYLSTQKISTMLSLVRTV